MTVSLQHFNGPAPHFSPLSFPPQRLFDPLLESSSHCTSWRFSPGSFSGRHAPKGCSVVVMHSVAADERATMGINGGFGKRRVKGERKISNRSQVQASVTKESSFPQPNTIPQLKIPCLFMRGGTSRGTYFLKQHLPHEKDAIDSVLLRVMGSPDTRQINGLGGATSVTSKVAIISVSEEPGVDVEFTFAQVLINKAFVDWGPSCGNMLAGVGPAAIEMGLITKIGNPVTPVRIRATNNGTLVEAIVQTPDHQLTYDGDARINGVPGTAAPVILNFMNVEGSKTGGQILPTGFLRDTINGVEVTCIDVAMPTVVAKASSLGKTGYETKAELDNDAAFFRRMEAIRVIAGKKMGLGDVTGRVIPKFAIVAEPRDKQNNLTARYFVPENTHPAMAVTGGICIGCCSILRGSVADDVSVKPRIRGTKSQVMIEHPTGSLQILLDSEQKADMPGLEVKSAGLLRTARLIFEGLVHIKADGLENSRLNQSLKGLDRYQIYHQQLQHNFRKLYKLKGPEKDMDAEWIGDIPSEIFVDELEDSVNSSVEA